MNRLRSLLAVVVLVVARASHATPINISVVGTTDVHGRVNSLPIFSGYLAIIRRHHPGHVVLVDSGDIFQGTLESDLNEGQTMVRGYRLLGYDAVAIGNHEFDYGPVGPRTLATQPGDDPRGALKAAIAAAKGYFPFLTADIDENGRSLGWPNVLPSTTVRLYDPAVNGEIIVGIIGVSTKDTPVTTIAANFAGLSMEPLADAIIREAGRLRAAGATVVLVAAHSGGHCTNLTDPNDLSSCDNNAEIFTVARALPATTVDAIFAGHAHTGIAHIVNGIPIVEAFAFGQDFDRIDLSYDPLLKRVVSAHVYAPTKLDPQAPYEGEPIVPDPAVTALAADATRAADHIRQRSLNTNLPHGLERRYHEESALGNFVASAMLALNPTANIAMTNGGGLRADIPAGPLTYGGLYTAIPFGNRFVIEKMTGAVLRQVMLKNFGATVGILSVAGMEVTATCKKGALDISVAAVAPNQPHVIKDDEVLTVALSDFLASGGDGFEGGEIVSHDQDAPVIREAVADWVSKRGGVIQPTDFYDPTHPRIHYTGQRPLHCTP